MKISYCRTLIYSLATAASAIAANAENLSLITGENKALTATGWNWSETSKWSPTVSEVAGNDLTIDAVTTTEITSTISDGFTAGDVNIILNQNAPSGSSGGHGHFFLNIDGNATFDNFTWKTTSAQWWGSYIKIKTGSTLTIRNDLTLGNSASNAYFISFIPDNDINYKGNLRIDGDINYYANGSNSSNALWTGLNSLTVKGAVSMINQNGNIGKWEIENNNTTIGGLSGADTSNNTIFLRKDTAITFTNSGDYSWNGSINSGKLFDIAMDDSATGKQTIKLTDGAIIAGKQPAATWLTLDEARAELEKGAAEWKWASNVKSNDEAQIVLAATGDVPTQEIMAAADKLDAMGIKFKVVNVVDLVKLQSAKENNEALSDEEFAELFTEDKPVLFAYHSYARDVRGLIYDRPNHDNFNVHGYEEQGSTTTPYDMVRVNNIDRYELQAEALRMIDADKYADKINELEAFRQEAFQFAVDNGYDHPDYTDWVYSGVNTNKQGAVSATAATAGDNE